jgi:alanine-alpha-ketoisovalerate/valine-pyruvate aminotransferase
MRFVFGENIVYCMSLSIETGLNRLTEVVQDLYQEAVVVLKTYLSLFYESSYEQSEKFISLTGS